MTLSCLKSPLLCALYTNLLHLTTNLFLNVLFCIFRVCYDVHLSHLNKDYLLTYQQSQRTLGDLHGTQPNMK